MFTKRILVRAAAVACFAIAPVAAATSAMALSFVSTQSAGEQSTSSLIGLKIENKAGDVLGDINYLVVDSAGKVNTAVVGVGGFLGIGEKNVGVPFSELQITTNKDGKQVGVIDATKESLAAAPIYVWTEKSTMDKLKDGAKDLTEKAKKGAADLSEKAKEGAADASRKAKEAMGKDEPATTPPAVTPAPDAPKSAPPTAQ